MLCMAGQSKRNIQKIEFRFRFLEGSDFENLNYFMRLERNSNLKPDSLLLFGPEGRADEASRVSEGGFFYTAAVEGGCVGSFF